MLIMNKPSKYNLAPMARIVSSAITGVEPRIMGIGPVYASESIKSWVNLDDIDIIELNEAFAAQSLACTRKWELLIMMLELIKWRCYCHWASTRMSGTRIIQTAAIELQKQNKICFGYFCVLVLVKVMLQYRKSLNFHLRWLK